MSQPLQILRTEHLEAEVVLGQRARDKIFLLVNCIDRLQDAANIFYSLKEKAAKVLDGGDEIVETGRKLRKILSYPLWDRLNDQENEFTNQVENAVEEIESYFKHYLKL